ncbi:hypothetical protein BG004_006280 [Podila humilis]|nr:hypothetical protein BG004_006280 [Podila humilis]
MHALDLPEICALIATHLSKSELGHCILVSRQWADTFQPLFWRTLTVPIHKVTRCLDADLDRHGHHIRILAAGRIGQTSPFDQRSVSHLQDLEAATCTSNDVLDHGLGCLPSIVQRNKESLVSFHWMCYGRDLALNKAFRIWPNVFLGLEYLETLVLSRWTLSIDDFLKILKACPNLNTLTFEATEDLEDPNSTNNLMMMSGSRMSIRRLSKEMAAIDLNNNKLEDNDESDQQQQPLFFQHHNVHTVNYIGNAMPGYLRHLPKVQYLSLQQLLHGNLSTIPEEIRQFCPLISHLKNLTLSSNPSRFLSLIDSIHSLRSFQGRVPSEAMEEFLEKVLSKHSETIEVLCLAASESDGLRFNVWRFLESCPRLYDLQIPYKLEGSIETDNPSSSTTTTSTGLPTGFTSSYFSSPRFSRRRPYEPLKPWVCQDLHKLWLRIRDMDIQLMETIALDLCVDRLIPASEKVPKHSTSTAMTEQLVVPLLERTTATHQRHGHGYGHGHGHHAARVKSPLERMILEKLSGLKKLSKINIGADWYNLPEPKER